MVENNLISQLKKLSMASQEAIANGNNKNQFDRLKDYLHIEREIQKELEEVLKISIADDKAKLILLCGNAGDGKSHILARLQNEMPEIMSQFTIYNDATESISKNKTCIETLHERIKGFRDETIDNTHDKVILAINLGILHNFLESQEGRLYFTRFNEYIQTTKILEDCSIQKIQDNNFSIVSFSNYQLFELYNDKVSSCYLEGLLSKITAHQDGNLFLEAFSQDDKEGYLTHTTINYKVFSNSKIRETIIQLIIESIIRYKRVFSTRKILDVIYQILVPEKDTKVIKKSIENLNLLLPNLLFEGKGKSKELEAIAYLDPIHKRSEQQDRIISEIHTSKNLKETIGKYIQDQYIKECIINMLPEKAELTEKEYTIIIKTVLRTYFMYHYTEEFIDEEYNEYISRLYQMQTQETLAIKSLSALVKQAMLRWKGDIQKEYIYDNHSNENILVGKKLKYVISRKKVSQSKQESYQQFKTVIDMEFKSQVNQNIIPLEIDYPLYVLIKRINNYYKPNKKDSEGALKLTKFIEKLLQEALAEDEIVLELKNEKKKFKLYINELEEFEFRRISE